MNEIDLYVSLIDEEEANKILKFFNQTTKIGNLEFKKTKIKTIFRGQKSIKKRSSFGSNPFWEILQGHQIERFKTYEEKEFLMILNYEDDDISDYVKLANLIIKLPNKVNEYLKLMTENMKLDKYLFDFGIMFNDESEIINYFIKTSYINNNKLLLSFIEKYYNRALKDEFIFPMENTERVVVRNYSIQQLFDRIQKESKNNILNIKYEYVRTHPEIERELFVGFCGDIIIELVNIWCPSRNKDFNKKTSIDMDSIKALENKLKSLNEANKNVNKEYNSYLKKSQKEIKVKTKELEQFKNEVKSLKLQSVEMSNLAEQVKILKDKNKELEMKYKDGKNKNKEYEKKIRDTKTYYEYAFNLRELNEENKIGIIHSMEYINLAKIIFNEIKFITLNNWKEHVNKLEEIYIQREGIPTGKLEEIKTYCSKRGITNKVISIDNEKTLIENIALIKANWRAI